MFARDLIELLDRLEIKSCVAVGHSLGGLIVSALAVEYPDRICGVVCLDPSYGVTGDEVDGCKAVIDQMSKPDWPQLLAKEFAGWERASTQVYFRELHRRRMLAMDRTVVKETFLQAFAGVDPLAYRERSETYFARRTCPVLGIYALR